MINKVPSDLATLGVSLCGKARGSEETEKKKKHVSKVTLYSIRDDTIFSKFKKSILFI